MSPPPWTLFWPRSGHEPGAVAADVAGQQREVDQREHVVDRVVVLGDAERPADLRALGAWRRRARARGSPRRGRRSRAPRASSVYGSTGAAYASKPVVARRTNSSLHEPGLDDLPADRVRERDVGADVDARATGPPTAPSVVRRGSTAYIARPLRIPFSTWWKKIGCASRAFEPQRRSGPRPRPPVGARPSACTEHRRQTDDARGVSGSVAAVDVVAADDGARELLRDVVHLVRAPSSS